MLSNENYFPGKHTFKQKKCWIPQIDWAIISKQAVNNIIDFEILQASELPTNHAALCLKLGNFYTDPVVQQQQAKQLGVSDIRTAIPSRPVFRMNYIDMCKFTQHLPDPVNIWNESEDVNLLCTKITDTLCKTAGMCRSKHRSNSAGEPST